MARPASLLALFCAVHIALAALTAVLLPHASAAALQVPDPDDPDWAAAFLSRDESDRLCGALFEPNQPSSALPLCDHLTLQYGGMQIGNIVDFASLLPF
jgi:hypothetical protein